MNIFVCSMCGKTLEAEHLVRQTCVHCGKFYEPICSQMVTSREVYDREAEVVKSIEVPVVTDEALKFFISYATRERLVDQMLAKDSRTIVIMQAEKMREMNLRILFRASA